MASFQSCQRVSVGSHAASPKRSTNEVIDLQSYSVLHVLYKTEWIFLRFRVSYVTHDREINLRLKLFLRPVLTPRDELDRFKDLWEPLYLHYVFFFFWFFSRCVSKKLIILGSPKVFSGVTTVIISHLWWVILGALYSGFVWPGRKNHRKYHHYQRDTFDRCNARLRQGSEL